MKYVIDLFCGEGGISRGYADYGYAVVGVDNEDVRLARYPYPSFTGDWEAGLFYWLGRLETKNIAFIHASPPCQCYSAASEMARARGIEVNYPDLIPPVRALLEELYESRGIHYVIENVPEAPLKDPVILCGSMFNLVSHWHGQLVGLKRHRGFEATFPITVPGPDICDSYYTVPVYGHGAPGYRKDAKFRFQGGGFAQLCRDVMGIHWMTRDGLDEAIPPEYARHVASCFGNQAS